MESVTVNGGAEPSDEAVLATLEEQAASAPATTEEALARRDADKTALPEEFTSVEDLRKAYEELKRKQGSAEEPEEEVTEGGVEEPEEGSEEAPAEETEEAPKEEAEEEEKAEEYTTNDVVEYLTERFSELDGTLDDDDYALAETYGFDKQMVDNYIAGQQAAAELASYKMNEAAGGAENLEAMLIWAQTGLSAAEIDAYNTALADNDLGRATLGVAKLREQYEAQHGKEPKLLGGKPARANASTFGSWAEVSAAMADPRYSRDATYNAQVVAKLERSSL
jgi:hypothetical protein